jgi:ferric-dicitrate binding protein FerR (iron transport regulator)
MTTAAIKDSVHLWANPSNIEERKQFNAWLSTASLDDVTEAMDYYDAYLLINPLPVAFSEQLHQKIEASLDAFDTAATPKNKLIQLQVFKVAVAVVLLLGAIWYVYNKTTETTSSPLASMEERFKNDVPAGIDLAFIQLSGGRTIALDAGHTSEINQTTSAQLDTANAMIAFTSSNDAIDTTTYLVSTPRGGKFQLQLSDGTKVWLNAASAIRFPKTFSKTERWVELSGEAYFEVHENKQSLFKVFANEVEVKVLGTHFNVHAYNNENEINTTLLEGSVQLTANSQTTLLKPGFQALFANEQMKVSAANINQAVAWKNGLFVFEKTPVKKILQQFERWYNVDVQYAGAIPTQVFVGEFGRDFTLAQSLRILEYSGIHFKINGRTITVL